MRNRLKPENSVSGANGDLASDLDILNFSESVNF